MQILKVYYKLDLLSHSERLEPSKNRLKSSQKSLTGAKNTDKSLIKCIKVRVGH